MPYIIYNSDETVLVTLADGQVDTETTSLDLLGKNLNNYGQYLNGNFVKLLTNFASTTSPRSPQIGQIWYDKSNNKLNVHNGNEFVPAYGAYVGLTEPANKATGDLWYDTDKNQMFIWDGSTFQLIGPDLESSFGNFGIKPLNDIDRILENSTSDPKNVGIIYSYGDVVGYISTSAFTMSSSDSLEFLGTSDPTPVVNGLTVFNDLEVKGNIYVQGVTKTAVKHLTAYFNITPYGDPTDVGASASTLQSRINDANSELKNNILEKMFPVSLSSTETYTYPLNSEVRVLCAYNTSNSVRRFRLEEVSPGNYKWQPLNLYFNSQTGSNDNIIR